MPLSLPAKLMMCVIYVTFNNFSVTYDFSILTKMWWNLVIKLLLLMLLLCCELNVIVNNVQLTQATRLTRWGYSKSIKPVSKVYINGPGHMTKMAAMPIYGKYLKNLL